MGAYITYSDTLPRYFDTRKITLDKILQALNNGAGGGGGGTTDTFVSSGVPSNGVGVNGNVAWDQTNKDMYIKDGGAWRLIVDTE